jgi:hypothetical protein
MAISTKTNLENRSKRRMGTGIHTNCSFAGGEVKTTANGNKLLELWFANPLGENQKKTIFFPSDSPKLKDGESLQDAKDREMNAFTGACFDILIAFYAPDESVVSGDTLENFSKKVLDKLRAAQTRCNVLVHYTMDYKYTEFPRYDWIEKYQEGNPSNLRVSDVHRMTKKGESKQQEEPKRGPFF